MFSDIKELLYFANYIFKMRETVNKRFIFLKSKAHSFRSGKKNKPDVWQMCI